MSTITIAILIFVVTLILYGVNKFSMGTVGMITMAALLVTGCLAPKDALGYFANKNVILMLSMFVVSAGLSRTTFLDAFSDTIVKLAKGSFKRTYLCYIVMAVILTNLLSSPLVVFTILLPLVDSMCKRYEISPSKVMFPIGLCCVACCCIMPFGAAIGQSALYSGFLESYGYDIAFTPLDFFKGRWPFLLIVPAWAFTMGYKIAPEKPITDVASVVVSGKTKQKLNKFADIAGVVIFFGVVVLCCVSDKIGVETWVICLVGAVLDLVCGVLTSKEAIAALPVSLACMLIGSLAMAGALTATGAGDVIGGFLSNVVGGMNNAYALGAVFFLLPFILTQFMQNQAVMAMFIPICLMACRNLNANPLGFMVLITAGSLTAFMTPMATSCIPAVMGAGGYDIKSLVKQGILPSAIFAVIYIFYTMTVMPV